MQMSEEILPEAAHPAVILSEAKDLHLLRPQREKQILRLRYAPLRMTTTAAAPQWVPHPTQSVGWVGASFPPTRCHPERSEGPAFLTPHRAPMQTPLTHRTASNPPTSPRCHPERSEGPAFLTPQRDEADPSTPPRSAQDDNDRSGTTMGAPSYAKRRVGRRFTPTPRTRCHPERSEGPAFLSPQRDEADPSTPLRSAQDD